MFYRQSVTSQNKYCKKSFEIEIESYWWFITEVILLPSQSKVGCCGCWGGCCGFWYRSGTCMWVLLHSDGAVGPSWIALWSGGVLNLFSICSMNFLRSISFVLRLLVQYDTIQLYAMYMKSTTTTISANTSSMPQIEAEHSHPLLEFSVPTFTRPMLV